MSIAPLHRAVEERAVELHVAEGVDVRVPVVVIVGAHVVLGESDRSRPDVHVGQHRHVMVGRLRGRDAGLGAERLAERDGDAGLDEPGRGRDAGGREVVQGPSPPVARPAAPVGDGVEELAKLPLGHVHGGHGGHPRERETHSRIISSG